MTGEENVILATTFSRFASTARKDPRRVVALHGKNQANGNLRIIRDLTLSGIRLIGCGRTRFCQDADKAGSELARLRKINSLASAR
jgi:hypothetical protein